MTGGSHSALAARYHGFAEVEVAGKSPLYQVLARAVAQDEQVLGFLLTLPEHKRQPNLLLAAFRHLFGTPDTPLHFRNTLLARADAVRAVMLSYSTQTNEPGRCAVLLPVLARLPQPLALVEIGAAAGLCLLPDCYGYDDGTRCLLPRDATGDVPILPCRYSGEAMPASLPRIAWRVGLDLAPLDAARPADAAWLENLVWPEQPERLARLRAALRIAATTRPRIVRGDLLGNALPALCREAATGGKAATLVVFNIATLAYVPDAGARAEFAARVAGLCDVWISMEAPQVVPGLQHGLAPPCDPSAFLLAVNGRPTAWCDPHGAELNRIADAAPWETK
jgi:hypothetical protein